MTTLITTETFETVSIHCDECSILCGTGRNNDSWVQHTFDNGDSALQLCQNCADEFYDNNSDKYEWN